MARTPQTTPVRTKSGSPKKLRYHRNWPPERALPAWPYVEEVHLTPHRASGQWRKRHRGRDYYFGPIDDPLAALHAWRRDWPVITGAAGRPRPSRGARHTCETVCNAFLDDAKRRTERNELSVRTYSDYCTACRAFLAVVGHNTRWSDLQPAHFERCIDRWSSNSPHVPRKRIVIVNMVGGFVADTLQLDRPKTPRSWRAPKPRVLRDHSESSRSRILTPEKCRALIAGADYPLRAFVLLGLNVAAGNTDAATIPASAVQERRGMLIYRRQKTGILRKAPLWPETVAALDELERRGLRDNELGLLAVTRRGRPYVHDTVDNIAPMFAQLAERLNIRDTDGSRHTFYDLRFTAISVMNEVPDNDAHGQKIIAGHAIDNIHGNYRRHFREDVLIAIVDHVRRYVWPTAKPMPGGWAYANITTPRE